jgi:hypothetical protein
MAQSSWHSTATSWRRSTQLRQVRARTLRHAWERRERQPQLPNFGELEALTGEYEAVEGALLANVERGLSNILLGHSEQCEEDLVRLAFTSTIKFDRLERVIRKALRSSTHHETIARTFNLILYRRGSLQSTQGDRCEGSAQAEESGLAKSACANGEARGPDWDD